MKGKEIYQMPLRLDKKMEALIRRLSKKNNRSLNKEVITAIENHIEQNRDKLK